MTAFLPLIDHSLANRQVREHGLCYTLYSMQQQSQSLRSKKASLPRGWLGVSTNEKEPSGSGWLAGGSAEEVHILGLLLKHLSFHGDESASCRDNQQSKPTTSSHDHDPHAEEENQRKGGRQLDLLPDPAAERPHAAGAPASAELLPGRATALERPGAQHPAAPGSSPPSCDPSPGAAPYYGNTRNSPGHCEAAPRSRCVKARTAIPRVQERRRTPNKTTGQGSLQGAVCQRCRPRARRGC